MTATTTPEEIIGFWWGLGEARWFKSSSALDDEMRQRFGPCHADALARRQGGWQESVAGRLALILLLDQFSRNIYRGRAEAYSGDAQALAVTRLSLSLKDDCILPLPHRRFYYLPFMHSEQLDDQETCVRLHEEIDDPDGLKWARHHAEIIRRFGRFPHRNDILARPSTAAEVAFLRDGGFAGTSASET